MLAALDPGAIAADIVRLVREPSVTGAERGAVETLAELAHARGLAATVQTHDLARLRAAPGYPGDAVALDQLAATLTELLAGDPTQSITLLAPHAMPAQNVVPIVAAASALAPVYLAATAAESPDGWPLVGAILLIGHLRP